VTYDPTTYWRKRGVSYEAALAPGLQNAQETILLPFLAGLEFASVLDVGCGYGRLGVLLRERRPEVIYAGVDVSPDQLASAQRHLPGAELFEASFADFQVGDRRWDLVLSVQFLMHVTPEQVESAVRKLIRLSSRHVVVAEWALPRDGKISGHNFLHDYEALLGDAGFGRTRPVEIIELGGRQRLFHIEKGRR
jgi:trans-aconitate methyltransferase